jgi:ABC-type branched-subunit amino acid transport system ATPase component
MLEVENLWVRYGSVEAVKGVSFSVPAGAIVSLIGPTAPARRRAFGR